MKNRKRGLASLAILAVTAIAVLTLLTGPALDAQAKPSCEVKCKKDYQQCRAYCGRPDVNCFVACETVYEWCLANCGSIIE
jgi:hypothetical protein